MKKIIKNTTIQKTTTEKKQKKITRKQRLNRRLGKKTKTQKDKLKHISNNKQQKQESKLGFPKMLLFWRKNLGNLLNNQERNPGNPCRFECGWIIFWARGKSGWWVFGWVCCWIFFRISVFQCFCLFFLSALLSLSFPVVFILFFCFFKSVVSLDCFLLFVCFDFFSWFWGSVRNLFHNPNFRWFQWDEFQIYPGNWW